MLYKIIAAFVFILFAACKSNTVKSPETESKKDTVKAIVIKKDFTGVKFAVNKDIACGMPLSAGLEDSAIYKNKVYGFCSKECKDEFLKNKAGYVAKIK